MEQSKQQQIRKLTDRLNRCRYEYYNLNAPSLTDAEYDALYDELSALEKETGFSMTNSPTQTVGCYPAVSALVKTAHPIPLLSLDKTKSSAELLRFAGEQMVMLMLKLDGLTVKLTYENGLLMEAATRGDGDTGENITHNVLGISGIPDKIPYKERLVVTGEAFIRPSDFEALRDTLRDGNGEPYKNRRNLAASSVRLLDCGACKDRRVTFKRAGGLYRIRLEIAAASGHRTARLSHLQISGEQAGVDAVRYGRRYPAPAEIRAGKRHTYRWHRGHLQRRRLCEILRPDRASL